MVSYCPDRYKGQLCFHTIFNQFYFNMNYLDHKPKYVDATIRMNILQARQSMSDNESFSIA